MLSGCFIFTPTNNVETPKVPKNIIVMFSDGTGIAHLEITRQYNRAIHNEPFFITDTLFNAGSLALVSNPSASSLVTDSAAAGSAMATGAKINNGSISVLPNGAIARSVADMALAKGMRLGIASNAAITDASPAAFGGAHVENRKDQATIASQFYANKLGILLGGGRAYFLPKGTGADGKREDGINLIDNFKSAGYQYVDDLKSLQQAQGSKVLGLFASKDMGFVTDRSASEPSIYDMTKTMLKLISTDNSKGFLAFIENEHTDTASHNTDIANAIKHLREFDKSVALAYEFYKKNADDTLLIVTTDHETGGLSFTYALKNMQSSSKKNWIFPTAEVFQKVKNIHISVDKATKLLLASPTEETINNFMSKYFEGFTLDQDLRNLLLNKGHYSRTLNYPIKGVLGEMIARNTNLYWGSSGHTLQPIFAVAIGPGSERFSGYMDNTDFGKHLQALVQSK